MATRARATIALTAVILATSGCASKGDEPVANGSATATAAASSTTTKSTRSRAPSDVEVEKYADINCENWPQQPLARRLAAAQAALDWLRKHPDTLGPELDAPVPTVSQVNSFAAAITDECAGRQQSSHLVQLVAVATVVYNERPEYNPHAG